MKRKSTGLIGLLIVLICWQSYVWYTISFGVPTRSEFISFGAPFASEIYSGQFWGVVTNSFLHVNIFHFLINLLMLLLFARRVERSYGLLYFMFFGFASSLITSSVQLAMSGDAGIGMSGVSVAFLYFMLGDKNSYWKWKLFKPFALVLGIFILLFALINLKTQWILLGFSSIISGIIFGYIVGLLQGNNKIQLSFVSLVLGVCLLSLFYNPFSSEWNTVKGYDSFKIGQLKTARKYYNQAVILSEKNVVAKKNLNLIIIDSLSSVAFKQHSIKNYDEARKAYNKILGLDSNYVWAKENIKRLP
ncbi:MAG: rhomboid family intramembrane serine protease [Bacteroidetes bacterium]|nr:rhomboid family intramembrane serine protease [Bacteroidota bacterium]